ncbi:hypothetical protein QGN23_06600 [Chryseobacterium gotjawalense]|uniref:Type II toxin-antitoxin system RelE/ParE family toxin n=1 Tax=Chryseobacterium gotjawalense TaxID=3042315 RepID=A0ABY8RIB8_9FLAO|nr:hypothetical protein [Chryseobacterium sp. wdc7]WHF52942.1 hypothetical protein QGN23_06600 [Chryseobacterium sp. wdc7]
MKFVISPTARVSLNKILDFLKLRWTKREINTFKNDIKKFKQTINDGIVKHQSLDNFPQIQYAFVGKK